MPTENAHTKSLVGEIDRVTGVANSFSHFLLSMRIRKL